MDEDVQEIFRQVVQAQSPGPESAGLGSLITALVAKRALQQPIPEWRRKEIPPALFAPRSCHG
jgi:hypothetical protein